MLLTVVLVLLVQLTELQLCSSKAGSTVSGIEVYADTVLEVNGVAQVPPVFGLT